MKNPEHPIYSDNGIQIYVNDNTSQLADYNERMKRSNIRSTIIYFYRCSKYGFTCNVELNSWGRSSAIEAFKAVGLNVAFDAVSREFTIQNTRDKFNFVLKYGGFSDK